MSATMISVVSSAIRAVGYDGSTLYVEFWNGRTYPLRGVPERHFYGLLNSSSPGWYWNTYLRGNY
jgi:KTSC domain